MWLFQMCRQVRALCSVSGRAVADRLMFVASTNQHVTIMRTKNLWGESIRRSGQKEGPHSNDGNQYRERVLRSGAMRVAVVAQEHSTDHPRADNQAEDRRELALMWRAPPKRRLGGFPPVRDEQP